MSEISLHVHSEANRFRFLLDLASTEHVPRRISNRANFDDAFVNFDERSNFDELPN